MWRWQDWPEKMIADGATGENPWPVRANMVVVSWQTGPESFSE